MATISSPAEPPKAPAPTGTSHPYTCNTCQVAFRHGDLQKAHMKGDWHRYNLKRRLADLAPISSEVFAEKVVQAQATSTAQADKAGFERACRVCQRTYYSENSFRNHMSSQKHRARQAALAARDEEQQPTPTDEAGSVASSVFSLAEPHAAAVRTSAAAVDPDAEMEFVRIIEGLKIKAAATNEKSSPVKRPSNPHQSGAARAGEQDKGDDDSVSVSTAAAAAAAASTPIKTSGPPPSVMSCLFCNYQSPTVALNLAHMERFHGLFLPERDYLVDVEGLVAMLQQRIREHFECIFCGKVRSDVFAIQTHMRDKGHCKIPYTTVEEQLEIGQFYDFRATYSDSLSDTDDDDDDEPPEKGQPVGGGGGGGGAKLGAKRSTVVTGAEGGDANEDWETDSSASSLDSADLHAVPADNHYVQFERLDKHPHHSLTDPRAHHQKDGWHSHAHKHNHAVFYDEYELHLPSGKSVGHRSLNRYFRQNLRHYPTPEERLDRERLAILAREEEWDDGGEEAAEGDGGGRSGATRENWASGTRDLAARARGAPDATWVSMRNSGQKAGLAMLKAQERAVNQRKSTKSTMHFVTRGRED